MPFMLTELEAVVKVRFMYWFWGLSLLFLDVVGAIGCFKARIVA